MQVYCLERTIADVPADDEWLDKNESIRLSGIRFPKRRADWRLGRWTAKLAVAAYLNLRTSPEDLRSIAIVPAASGAPEVVVAREPGAAAISLSHSGGTAICAVAQAGAILGCDVEIIEPHTAAFIADYFTDDEQASIDRASPADRDSLVCLLWSAKESALKALRLGLRMDTRCVAVILLPSMANHWSALETSHAGSIFRGFWRQAGAFVWTLVASPAPEIPIELRAPVGRASSGEASELQPGFVGTGRIDVAHTRACDGSAEALPPQP